MLEQFSDLLGHTLVEIKGEVNDDEIIFTLENGDKYMLYHYQDCCETVYVQDIIGDLHDLIGLPILLAEEVRSEENPEGVEFEYQYSYTWTFYKLATNRGYATIRWYGESNGYYSESVDW